MIQSFFQLIILIYSLQRKLARKDIWVRGGISFGNSHFDSTLNQIIGEAYVKAYELELKAIQPRVILDCGLITELGCSTSQELIEKINTFNSDKAMYAGKIGLYDWLGKVLDKDFPLFVDYLNSLPEVDKTVIANYIVANARSNEVYPKYKWLVDYFSSVETDANILKLLKGV